MCGSSVRKFAPIIITRDGEAHFQIYYSGEHIFQSPIDSLQIHLIAASAVSGDKINLFAAAEGGT